MTVMSDPPSAWNLGRTEIVSGDPVLASAHSPSSGFPESLATEAMAGDTVGSTRTNDVKPPTLGRLATLCGRSALCEAFVQTCVKHIHMM